MRRVSLVSGAALALAAGYLALDTSPDAAPVVAVMFMFSVLVPLL